MKRGNKVVMGIFDSRAQAENCVDTLKAAGFRNSDISVLLPQMGEQSFGHEKATKAPEGATTGTGIGAVLGGTLGWLVGAGVIATIPVLGPFVAAGPIMAALAGAAAGGAVGGITGTLVGFGIPEYEAKRYETFVSKGGILLSAHVDDREWADKAKDILEQCGAHDITSTKEADSDVDSDRKNKDASVYASDTHVSDRNMMGDTSYNESSAYTTSSTSSDDVLIDTGIDQGTVRRNEDVSGVGVKRDLNDRNPSR